MDFVRILGRDFWETGIAGDYTELSYTEEFRGAGEFSMTLPITSPSAKLLMPDGYVRVPGGLMYRIISVERDARAGVVRTEGAGLLSLFGGTAIGDEYKYTGNCSALLNALARKGAGQLPADLTFGSTTVDKMVTIASGRSYLYDDLVSLCYLGGVGMRLEYRDGALVFTVCVPNDRTAGSYDPVLISPRMGNFDSDSLVWDLGAYKNVAVVSGAEKEDGRRYTVTVRADGLSLEGDFPDQEYFDRQMLVNFTAPVRPYMFENAEGLLELDEEAYLAAMTASGAAALGRCRPKLYLYGGKDADADSLSVGDTVTVSDGELGVSGSALVQRITTSCTHEGRTVRTELCAESDSYITL